MQKTDVAEVPDAEAALPDAEAVSSVDETHDAKEDQHLAEAHHLTKVFAYVKAKPKTAGQRKASADSVRKAGAGRMKRFRANKEAQGLVQAYVPADILGIAKTDGGDWESVRAAVAIGRRALALRGWRAKIVALLLPRS